MPFVKSDACSPESIPLTVRDGIALARIAINQKPMTLIVDSAGMTIINADRITLPIVRQLRTGPVTISAADPLVWWNVVKISSLGLGNKQIRDVNVLSRSLQQLEAILKTEVDGILGADMLALWDSVSFDYRHKALVLEGSHCGETKDAVPPMISESLAFRRR